MFGFILIFLVMLKLSESKIILESCVFTTNEQFGKLKTNYVNSADGKYYINATYDLYRDALKTQMQIVFAVRGSPSDNYVLLVSNTFDLCKIAKGFVGNFAFQILFKDIDKFANFKFECPQKKGLYVVTNYYVDEKIIPPVVYSMFSKRVQFKGNMTLSGTLEKKKAVVWLTAGSVTGSYYKTEDQ